MSLVCNREKHEKYKFKASLLAIICRQNQTRGTFAKSELKKIRGELAILQKPKIRRAHGIWASNTDKKHQTNNSYSRVTVIRATRSSKCQCNVCAVLLLVKRFNKFRSHRTSSQWSLIIAKQIVAVAATVINNVAVKKMIGDGAKHEPLVGVAVGVVVVVVVVVLCPMAELFPPFGPSSIWCCCSCCISGTILLRFVGKRCCTFSVAASIKSLCAWWMLVVVWKSRWL